MSTMLITIMSYGQDIQYSQYYAAPLYLNPALAGVSDGSRLIFNYRSQWASLPSAFTSSSVSYDINLYNVNSGVGVVMNYDKAGSGGLRTITFGGVYSYDLQVRRNLSIRAGVGLWYNQRNIDWSKLQFNDQLVSGNETSYESAYDMEDTRYFDIPLGIIMYGEWYWVGYSIYHVNTPNYSLVGMESMLDPRHTVHAGVRMVTKMSRNNQVEQSLFFSANYKAQNKWDQFDIGAYYFMDPVFIGLWYRGLPGLKSYESGYSNQDAVVLMGGVKVKKLKFIYSYDITTSDLWQNTGGSHEISVTLEHYKKRTKRKRRLRLKCPDF
jgi:type IX secretion system PorP/SprF family membrane protein